MSKQTNSKTIKTSIGGQAVIEGDDARSEADRSFGPYARPEHLHRDLGHSQLQQMV